MERYCRQTILAQIGMHGQARLAAASAAIVGLGATGGFIADLLTRAGVGHIRLIDRDTVDLSNLQRQVLYGEPEIGIPKAEAATKRLRSVNSGIDLEAMAKDVNPGTIGALLGDTGIIMDGTDNIRTRFLINDFAVLRGIPWVYSGAVGTGGMEMAVIPGETPCIRCLMPEAPPAGSLPTCDVAGVLNTVPAVIGSIAVTDAIQVITGQLKSDEGAGRLHIFDAWEHTLDTVKVPRDGGCLCCGKRQFDHLSLRVHESAIPLCGSGSVQITPLEPMKIRLDELAARLHLLGEVRYTRYMVRFRTGELELSIFEDGRAIVRGARDETAARGLYARYIGE